MSIEQSSSRYTWKSAVIATSLSMVVVVIVWVTFGRKWEDAAEKLIAQEQAQQQLNSGLEQLHETLQQTDRKLSAMESSIAGSPGQGDEKTQEQVSQINSWIQEQQTRTAELDETLAASRATAARQRSQTVMLVHRGRQIEQQLTSLAVRAASWAETYRRILTSDPGRRIASSDQHLELISAVASRHHVTVEELNSWQQEFDALYEPVRVAEADTRSVFVADDGFEPAMQRFETRIREAQDVFRKDGLLMDAMVRETAEHKPSELTLKEALASRELNAVKRQAKDLFIAREEARDEATRRLEAAEAASIEAATRVEEAELERQAAERRAIAAGIVDERKKLDQEAEQRRRLELDYARELPEIRRLLHPFITPGIFQPSPNGFEGRYRPESMSLSSIASTGALQKTEKGLTALYRVGGSEFIAMRGLGSFPAYRVQSFKRDPSVRKRVERAQSTATCSRKRASCWIDHDEISDWFPAGIPLSLDAPGPERSVGSSAGADGTRPCTGLARPRRASLDRSGRGRTQSLRLRWTLRRAGLLNVARQGQINNSDGHKVACSPACDVTVSHATSHAMSAGGSLRFF